MKKIVFTTDELDTMLAVFGVDLSRVCAKDILTLVELTPLTRDLIFDMVEQQLRVGMKTRMNVLRAEAEEALESMQ